MPTSLRALRRASGLSQADLAARAGVTRQLVAAAEAGRHVPSVEAAIRIARVLGVSVEEAFAEPPRAWAPALDGGIEDGDLIVAARVGERLVIAPLRDELARGAAWAAPDGIMESGTPRLFAPASVDGFLVLGCEPALGIASELLGRSGSRRLLALPATSGQALEALREGRCHAAVVHGPAGGLPRAPRGVRRLHLARWRVGLASTRPLTLADALRGRRRLVQREASAASQQALARAAAAHGAQVPSGPVAAGHLDAARLAQHSGAVAVTYEPAAARFGLAFLALETHIVEVWVAERFLDHPGLGALGELLSGRSLRERLAAIGGYDLEGIGARRDAA
jgi:transcriptional regulator with XRE-family HTH domain